MRHPIFVVGMPRSGTTLLSAMLDAHPGIAITPETHFYTRCRSSADAPAAALRETWARLRQQPGVQDMAFGEAELAGIWETVRAQGTPDPSALLRELGTSFAQRAGAAAWGEKTPDHLPHVPDLLADFPDAVVVALIRDPRDVCLSLRGLPWNQDSLPESAWKWRRYARLAHRYRHDVPSRFREVRYERLLEAPDAVIRDLLDWIDAPFDPSVLSFHEHHPGPADADREPWKGKVHQPIDPENKAKWRNRMGPAERWVVQRIAGRWLQKWGYPTPPVPLNRAFCVDLGVVVARSLRSIGNRMLRRWRTPSRPAGDHRPTWMRRGEAGD
ncbi:MAG: sulfotransferase [Salinibacter sp.]